MTAPVDAPDTLEHLEHEPACGVNGHQGTAPAVFWVVVHDCKDVLACAPCVRRKRETAATDIANHGWVSCRDCHGSFTTFEDWAKVTPL